MLKLPSLAERGSALLLFPAAVFVVLVMGALAVDVGLGQVRARELQAVADSAANDVLGAVDVDRLRNNGVVSFDGDQAKAVATASVARGPLPEARVIEVRPGNVNPANGLAEIVVVMQLDVEFIIAPALPGDLDELTYTRTGRAYVIDQ